MQPFLDILNALSSVSTIISLALTIQSAEGHCMLESRSVRPSDDSKVEPSLGGSERRLSPDDVCFAKSLSKIDGRILSSVLERINRVIARLAKAIDDDLNDPETIAKLQESATEQICFLLGLIRKNNGDRLPDHPAVISLNAAYRCC